ncbi:MAG: AbgT family transporter [Prevotellaceae bacterium]|nr:AbgT family transporter [Prevotellaceae bacterium]MDY3365907.1 hypothetical protein [Prevotella sp.]
MQRLTRRIKNFCAITSLVIVVAQLALVLGSWIFSVIFPNMHLRSLLGGEGLRWFFDSIGNNLANKGLVIILLVGMLTGSVRHSRILDVLTKYRSLNYREKFAFTLIAFELVLFIVIMGLFTLTPHAPLLSATGELFPSSFSRGFIPLMSTYLCFVSVTYGLASGRLKTAVDVLDNLTSGIVYILPLLFLYFFVFEFYRSILFVLRL